MKVDNIGSHGTSTIRKVERKTVEKNRRTHMKKLCFKLSSIIPKEHRSIHKDVLTQQDNLEDATSYIKILRERIEILKQRRLLQVSKTRSTDVAIGFGLPIVEVRCNDVNLEVLIVISSSGGVSKRFLFHEVISVLEEEGAKVVNANFSVVGDKIFHIIHSQAVSSRIGLDASRVTQRLKELVN
ncbi:transcription factor bHLH162-like isoform X1 [Curcuma longa]|uniref:transcription factor bHLH162-like isoform X1 n=1 Tax=Curcuma longa TaxID=136217 RepID=UPI003D9F687A